MSSAPSMPRVRPKSESSSDSDLLDSDIGDPDPEVEAGGRTAPLDKAGFQRIFMDAVRFGEVLDEDGSECTAKKAATGVDNDAESIRRFADLVGRDLSQPDLATSSRFAKIKVNTWLQEEDGLNGQVTAEPEELEELEGEEEPEGPQPVPALEHAAETIIPYAPLREDSITKLPAEEIVKLLVDEFGSLATSETDEERLVVEMEGAYFQDVAILGMIHLTTHRLTFHASLLSTRPDLLPEQQVIKKGPVTIHRPGFRRKRRLWLELSHDMLTTFPSGRDEDRIKPIRSILLTSIKEVLPEDPENARIIRIIDMRKDGPYQGHAEFDTEESARDWRRELLGAVYLQRHRRTEYLRRQPEEESNGVRMNIPLSRVKKLTCRKFMNFSTALVIEVSDSPPSLSDSRESPEGSGSDVDDGDIRRSLDDDEVDSELDGRTLEVCVLQRQHAWEEIDKLVAEAKEKARNATIRLSPRVIVDFGALSFVEQGMTTGKIENDKEEAIRRALSLGPKSEIWYTRSRISRSIMSTGYFVITHHYIAFWSKCLSIHDLKYRFPVNKVLDAKPYYRYRFGVFGMTLELKEHRSINFDFRTEELRNEVIRRIKDATNIRRPYAPHRSSSTLIQNSPQTQSRSSSMATGPGDHSGTGTPSSASSGITTTNVLSPLSLTINRAKSRRFTRETLPILPKILNIPPGLFPKMIAQHYVCLTIGSRGDIQPYIALGLGLQKEGHTVTIVTHAEYKAWIEGWGIRHRTAGGDPGALMKLSVEHKMFSPQFFKESLTNFRDWLDDLLVNSWEQCKDADVLLESPSAMAGVHIAEALNIPYFRCFTMPWTKTTQFPHPFLSPPVELTSFNASTYILFENVFWSATSGQINRWRKSTLQIGATDMGHMAQSKIPFIYNFSPSVVPKPLDWGDLISISGYWFLDNPDLNWTPPRTLLQWMTKARDDDKPIVYIGFGSITVPNPPAVTRSIIKAVLKSDIRAIVSKGWSSRMSKSEEPEIEFPPECYPIDVIPHDWLFPQVDAVLHHGGAGTTGASLRAGIPTLIKPWFGDQFFWASRVQKIGAGLRVSSLRSSDLANALIKATSDRIMRERAASIGERIRAESGVENAIRSIYTYLQRAVRDRSEVAE